MKGKDLIEALRLPGGCQLDQRVPKKLFIENSAPTSADKKLINDGIEDIRWVAALKPNTIGVREFRNEEREYIEIAVLQVKLREHSSTRRLIELMHRAIPYPAVFVIESPESLTMSLGNKRWSQSDSSRVVLDGELVISTFSLSTERTASETEFAKALSLNRQPQSNLYELYNGWTGTLEALSAAEITGQFQLLSSPESLVVRRAALEKLAAIDREIAFLESAAKSEKQMSRRVQLNNTLKSMNAERIILITKL